MLDMGFQPQIRRILEEVPQDRQTMLFSATLSGDIAAIATKHMRTPISIEVAPQGTTAEKVTQEFFLVNRDQKLPLLEAVLQKYTGSTLVFIRTKHGAKKLVDLLKRSGHNVAEIHGNRSLGQRKQALEGFKKGTYRILVATDIASRGIDVKGIELVINFDLPMDSADYVHRIGRTARAGAEGHAISFATPQERNGVRGIERLIRQTVSFSALPEHLPSPRMDFRQPEQRGSRSRGSSYGGQRGGYGRSGGSRSRTSGGNRGGNREYVHDSSTVTADNFQIRTGTGRDRRFRRGR
jgi:ATP-dependent RNA helicase RhlE